MFDPYFMAAQAEHPEMWPVMKGLRIMNLFNIPQKENKIIFDSKKHLVCIAVSHVRICIHKQGN